LLRGIRQQETWVADSVAVNPVSMPMEMVHGERISFHAEAFGRRNSAGIGSAQLLAGIVHRGAGVE